MNSVIESARSEHLPEIAALAALIWRAHYPGIISLEQIEYMLARRYDVEVMRGELTAGVAYDRLLLEGELRGFASYGPGSIAGELKLHKLYLHPDVQRQGLGARLLERVQSIAQARGFSTLMLAVNKRNTHAVAAYQKHGFTVREAVVSDIGGGFVMDDYIMAKPVRG